MCNQHFTPRLGTFSNSETAYIVAGRIWRFLVAGGLEVPERFINVEGKKGSYTVELPRIRHVWWPKANSAEAIGHELNEIYQAAKEALND